MLGQQQQQNWATAQDILDKARELIDANGETTTLDVKKALRADGFWTNQSHVSGALNDNHVSEGWGFTFNGQYRTYMPEDDVPDDAGDATTIANVLASLDAFFDSLDDGDTDDGGTDPKVTETDEVREASFVADKSEANWKVLVYDDNSMPVAWVKATDRNAARNLYRRAHKVDYFDVAAYVVRS